MLGVWKALREPYNGYLNTVNRLVAGVLSSLPALWMPTAYSFAALVIQSVSLGAFFLPNFRRLISSDTLRAACCLIAALTIPASFELIGTVCNINWYLGILSLLVLTMGGQSTTHKWVEACCTLMQVLIALTAPGTILFIPFLLWQLANKAGWLRLRPALHLAALFVQVWIVVHSNTGPRALIRFNTLFLATLSGGLTRCVLAPMIGSPFLKQDVDVTFIETLVLALILCVAVITAVVIQLRHSPRLWLFLSALYIGVGSVLLPITGRNFVPGLLTMGGIRGMQGERYFFTGACMFIFCIAFILDSFLPRWKAAGALIMAAMFAVGAMQNFAIPKLPDCGWQSSAAKIESWEASRRRHEKLETLIVPINPPGWTLTLQGN